MSVGDFWVIVAFVSAVIAAYLIGLQRGRQSMFGKLRKLGRDRYKGKDWKDVSKDV